MILPTYSKLGQSFSGSLVLVVKESGWDSGGGGGVGPGRSQMVAPTYLSGEHLDGI